MTPRPDPSAAIDPRARALADTIVRGHLKRVRVGEGRARIKWVYVGEYGARRWNGPSSRSVCHSPTPCGCSRYRGSHKPICVTIVIGPALGAPGRLIGSLVSRDGHVLVTSTPRSAIEYRSVLNDIITIAGSQGFRWLTIQWL